ncbi:MAG: hypothetical protein EXX96DRAFT_553973 [Benjaminiella poitrasii]|nr:MAG: hypothetical protein EXX96DRAFT_553973 [Benjaminiella poitrasii]
MPISLKACLWTICSASPDMICKDHDLSIYTANFYESAYGPSDKRDSFIWEGHGLMSWITDQTRKEIYIYGKPSVAYDNDTYITVYLELQPTLKWIQDDFFSAIKNKSFEQLRTTIQTPTHPVCNCYSWTDATSALPTSHMQPQSNVIKRNGIELDQYHLQKQNAQPSATYSSSPLSTILPSLSSTPILRPEPIFPSSSLTVSSNNNHKLSESNSLPHLSSLPETQSLYNKESSHNRADLTLADPIRSTYNSSITKLMDTNRRSAFTIAFTAITTDKNHCSTSNKSTSSLSSSSGSPISPQATYYNTNAKRVLTTHVDDKYNIKRSKHIIESDKNADNNSIISNNNKKRKKKLAIVSSTGPDCTQYHSLSPSRTIMPNGSNSMYQPHAKVNTNVRTYYEVEKDGNGSYVLPVEIDSWTVIDLGTIIYDRPAYHNARYIYPTNYTVRKWYRSMVDPKSDTQYTCRILENGKEPKFEVTADDCPTIYSGPTPTTVWTIIVRRAFAIRNQEYGHNPVGPDFFGLRKNTIAKMIQDLPNASKCSQYVWQVFEPARFNKPGRNRRRADSNVPSSLLGGVNYGLTTSRLTQLSNTTTVSSQQSKKHHSTLSNHNNDSGNSTDDGGGTLNHHSKTSPRPIEIN